MTSRTRPTLRLMVVGDDETSFGLIRDLLAEGGPGRYELDWVTEPPTDYEAVSEVYDGFLVDYHGRFQNGLEVIQSFVDSSGYAVPLILLDGAGGDALESLAMEAGASDCLSKTGLTRATLERSIWHAIERSRILSRLEAVSRDQLRHKDELLSHVSHELRTPVAAIYQFVSLVEDGSAGPLKDGQHQFLGIALKNVESLSRMINDLVDVARARGQGTIVHLRRTNIGRAVDQAMASVVFRAREKGVTLVSGPMPDTTLLADPGRVVQVIINLLDNAIKYTPSGGHIDVTVAMDPKHDGYITLCVADTGPGIDAKDRDLLFSPLVQLPQAEVTSRQGLGLGLHICTEIVRQHGGLLWVESDPPNGARFCFTLPVFAVADGVRRAAEHAQAKACDLVLFEVRLPTKGLPSQVARRLMDSAQSIIQHSTLPGDFVIPASERDDQTGRLQFLVAVDAAAAASVVVAVTNLLVEQIDLSSRGVPTIVFEVMATWSHRQTAPGEWVDQAIDRVADQVS